MLRLGVISIGVSAALLATNAAAALTGLRLSYADDRPATMTISWNTASASASWVRYGTSSGSLPNAQAGTTTAAPGALGFVHEVTLTGLTPETTYYYVADSGVDGVSPEHSFVTRPVADELCGETSFVFVGDSEPDPIFGGGESWAQIIDQAASHLPSFIVHGGDMVQDADDLAGWIDFLTMTAPVSAEIPFMPAMGNHDPGPGEGEEANFNRLFALPRSGGPFGTGTEDYYYFTTGNAIVVVLSTDTFTAGSQPLGEQAAWLDEVLTQNPRRWKLVVYHKPSYTYEDLFGTTHPPNEEGQNAALVSVIDAHHVDVVFSAHNHWYERYLPSACGKLGTPGSDQPCPVAGGYEEGTAYFVSGGGGALTIPGTSCGFQSGRAVCAGIHHYLHVRIVDETLSVVTWAAHPETNEIIDKIDIVKSADGDGDGVPDCSAAPEVPALPLAGTVVLGLTLCVAVISALNAEALLSRRA